VCLYVSDKLVSPPSFPTPHLRTDHCSSIEVSVCFSVSVSSLPKSAICCSVMQCVAVCCSVLLSLLSHDCQCVAACCSVLQCVAVYCSVFVFASLSSPTLPPFSLSCSLSLSHRYTLGLKCVTVCRSVLQCAAGCCRVLQRVAFILPTSTAAAGRACRREYTAQTHSIILQHTATHCNTLQHTAKHHIYVLHEQFRLQQLPLAEYAADNMQNKRTATHCNTLQHTATHCNTLQHTTTH